MRIALWAWTGLFLLWVLYRFRFRYKEGIDRPLGYHTAELLLASVQYLALGSFFVFAARKSEAFLFASSLLLASAMFLAVDWWAYRRELSSLARLHLSGSQMEQSNAYEVARIRLAKTALGSGYYKLRRKKAWLAFLLTIFFGPFGFLYYRWKVTAAIFACILPWTFLSQVPLRQVIGQGTTRYVILVGMAILAYLDVARTNDKIPSFEGS